MNNTIQKAYKILGVHTELIIQNYADRIVVILTQLNKPGTIISAEKDASNDPYSESYTVDPLFGKRADQESIPLEQIIARQVIEKVTKHRKSGPIPILITIGLEKQFESTIQADFATSQSFVKSITNIIQEHVLSLQPISIQTNIEQPIL
ncbi:proteasome assembly chaperone [Acrasis kona]|uniref:Proteasome assembly chaperone n=1 Tax=Acrasis kona TaxID=1008807 RepID=A0AAW2YY28_9EUKA